MIFQRSILREKITVTVVVLLTLLTITSVLFFVRGLRLAAVGRLGLEDVLQLMMVTTLKYLPLIMVLAVMIAITTTVSRLYRDSEMAVWQTSGLSNLSLLRPIAMLTIPMFLFVFFLNTTLTPWAIRQLAEYREQSNIKELMLVKNGMFRSTKNGERTFFVEQVNINDRLPEFKNIFVIQKNDKGTILLVGQQANLENTFDNRAFIVLKNGHQYDDKNNAKEHFFQSMNYSQYGFSLDEFTKVKSSDVSEIPAEERITSTLLNDKRPFAQSELYRRLSDSLMILPMVLMALVFGFVRTRGQRTWGILSGLLIFLIYLNMIKLGESRILYERWSFNRAMFVIHGGCMILALLALWYRYNSWRFSISWVNIKEIIGWDSK